MSPKGSLRPACGYPPPPACYPFPPNSCKTTMVLFFYRNRVICSNYDICNYRNRRKQYKVSDGDSLKIEKLAGDHKEGDTITFDKVLLIDDGKSTKVGTPYIEGAKVEAVFEGAGRNKRLSLSSTKQKAVTSKSAVIASLTQRLKFHLLNRYEKAPSSGAFLLSS